MNAINVYFDKYDYDELKKAKKGLSWRNFILTMFSAYKEASQQQKTGKADIKH